MKVKDKVEVTTWFEIEDDKKQVRCNGCGQVGNCPDMVYVKQPDYKDIIIHKKCLGVKWLTENKKGDTTARRTAHRIWWIRKPKLKLVKG